MRQSILFLSIVLIIIIGCEEDNPSHDGPLTYQETTYGGCFQDVSLKIYNEIQNDTLYIESSETDLKLVVIMNYNCCGNLIDEYEIVNNNLVNIYISDTCIDDCSCDCICGYVFNYYFFNIKDKSITFNVYLKGYMQDEYSFWKSLDYEG